MVILQREDPLLRNVTIEQGFASEKGTLQRSAIYSNAIILRRKELLQVKIALQVVAIISKFMLLMRAIHLKRVTVQIEDWILSCEISPYIDVSPQKRHPVEEGYSFESGNLT